MGILGRLSNLPQVGLNGAGGGDGAQSTGEVPFVFKSNERSRITLAPKAYCYYVRTPWLKCPRQSYKA